MLKRENLKASNALNMTKAVVAEQHIKVIKDFEESIEKAITEGEYGVVGTFKLDPSVLNLVKEHFAKLEYFVDVERPNTYTLVCIKWDEESLKKVKK
jgi:hypothetical protein